MNMTATLIAILATSALLAAGSALAQQTGPGYGPGPGSNWPCPRAQGMGRGAWDDSGDPVAARLDRMAWRLNLTDQQKAQLEPILRQRQELRMAQRQQMRDEVAAILTPEQLARFEQMGPGRGGRMGRGMGPGGGRGWNAPAPADAQ